MKKWEHHHFITYNLDKKINYYDEKLSIAEILDELGSDGWELVSVCHGHRNGTDFAFFFKRPIQ